MATKSGRRVRGVGLAGIVCALALAMGLCASAFATTPEGCRDVSNVTVTINDVAPGDTAQAFLIADAYINAENEIDYDESIIAGFTTPRNIEYFEGLASKSDGYVFTSKDTDMQKLAEEVAAELLGGTATYVSAPAGANGTVTLSVDSGYYLVVVKGTGGKTMVYQNMIVNAAPVVSEGEYVAPTIPAFTVKHSDVSLTKTSNGESVVTTASRGDLVPFTIAAPVPSYPDNAVQATFEICDTPTAGLVLQNTEANPVVVSATGLTTADYDVTVADDGSSLKVALHTDWVKAHPNTIVTVAYKALVTEAAYNNLVNDSASITENHATVNFTPNPYVNSDSTTDPKIVPVKTFGFMFKKVDKDGNALVGAEFKLDLGNGTVLVATSDANGYVLFEDLALGTYTVKESKIPAGKQAASEEDLTFVLTEDLCVNDNPLTTDVMEHNLLMKGTDTDGHAIPGNVVDPDKPVLPITGGAGTIALSAAAVLLIAAALFVLKRNRQSAR